MRELKSKLTGMRELMLLLIVVIVFIAMSLISPYFFTSANLTSVLLTLSIEAILVVGMVNLLISGGFDMSIGSVIGLAGGVAAFLMKNVGVPIWISIICAIAAGGLVGLFNGTAVAKLGIPPFVATLASKYMANGLLLVLMSGRTISGLPDEFTWIGQARIGQLQIPVIYMIIIVALGEFLLRKSRFFRQNYYIGGNFKAAKLSGIHNERMQIFNYVLMGLLAGLFGVIMSARLGSASTTSGLNYEMKVITACIIGGTSMSGGEGSVLGGFLGCILMAIITNSMTLLNVSVYWQTFVTGFTLFLAVLIDCMSKRNQNTKR